MEFENLLRMFSSPGPFNNSIRSTHMELAEQLAARFRREWSEGRLLHLVVGPIGSRSDSLYLLRFRDGSTYVRTGCFLDTLEIFEQTARDTYAEQTGYRYRYWIQYRTVIEAFRALDQADPVLFPAQAV